VSRGRFLKHEHTGKVSAAGGTPILLFPDRQRIINKLFMKGYCDKNGFPIHQSSLSALEGSIIIERYNAAITGLMQYYGEWVSWPSSMQRWVYVLRYSCFKTLAKKYKSSISKVFRRFGTDLYNTSTKTIKFDVEITVNKVTYVKTWKLLTFAAIRDKCLKQKFKEKLTRIFWEREQGLIGDYDIQSGRFPAITHENYLESMKWVSWRTQASFDIPCCICGSMDKVQMHPIKHIRKNPYREIEQKAFHQVMSLRNRKQIPVCEKCHMEVIHQGKYSGPALNALVNYNTKLVDNRIIHVDSFVKPGIEYYGKSLEERGWKQKYQNNGIDLQQESLK
jgi:hypothetical protein